jgi:hypothetical protein
VHEIGPERQPADRRPATGDRRPATGDRLRESAGHLGIGEGGTQSKEPQPGGGYALGRKATQIGRPLARQDVTQQVVVDDDGGHLRGSHIGIVGIADQSAMVLSGKSVGQEFLPAAWWQEDQGIAQVDHRHPSTVVQPPTMAHGRRHRHLSTG